MHAVWLVLFAFIVFFLGYRFYSKFIAQKIYKIDAQYKTPAHRYRDDIDFIPTNKYVLWGHHFTSIAGASPIVGPAIAIYWGWLPALLWVVLGTVFAAGVHDFGALVLSIRNKGQSVGSIASQFIGKRAKILFLLVILFLLLMLNAVFAWIIANLLISYPASVLSIFIQIPLAIWIGYSIRKHRQTSMLRLSIIALVIMYGSAVLASQVPMLQIDLVRYFGGESAQTLFGLNAVSLSFCVWIIVLMVYVYIASNLPVWKLLQPRDYINANQLVIGLFILYLGLFITNPIITAPAIQEGITDVSWFPLLFITIACGAISGFHGLVASGTTSKQINLETDARFIGYSATIGEGCLALISILAVATYFNSEADFSATYNSFAAASSGGLNAFINGAGQLANGIGIPATIGTTIIAIIVISFAATTLDSAVRLMRYIISEIGVEYQFNFLTKRHTATLIAVLATAALVFIPEGPSGLGSGGYLIWPLFGTANQLLAGITLLVVSLWLKKRGVRYGLLVIIIPMLFLLFMTLWALIQQIIIWSGMRTSDTQILLLVFGSLILCFTLWILVEAVLSLKRSLSHQSIDSLNDTEEK